MADTFKLQGSFSTTPLIGIPSGFPSLSGPIAETVQIKNRDTPQYTLTADTVQAVSFGGLAAANVILIKTVGGKVRVRLTSADGSLQAVPVDSFFSLISMATTITAIDLLRVPGVETTVQLFLGEL